jgi:hypothetical protein
MAKPWYLNSTKLLKVATAFEVPVEEEGEKPSHLWVRIEKRGNDRWCIRNESGVILNKKNQWVYEPQPSSRTEAFIQNTRFESVVEAFEFFYAYRKTIV